MKFGKQKAIGALIALGLGAMMTASAETASVTEASFGKTTEGKAVKLYTSCHHCS